LECTEAGRLFGVLQDELPLRAGVGYQVRLVARQRGLRAPLRVGLMSGDRPLSNVVKVTPGEDWTTVELSLKGPARQESGQLVVAGEGPGTVGWVPSR